MIQFSKLGQFDFVNAVENIRTLRLEQRRD